MPSKRTHEQRYHTLMKTAATYRPHRYHSEFVQPVFNKMIRAEAGACFGSVPAVVGGLACSVDSPLGYCVCVTCGDLQPWTSDKKAGLKGMDSGHFLTGQRVSLVEFNGEIAGNCHAQCVKCNRNNSGDTAIYRIYMQTVYLPEQIDALYQLKWNKKYEPPTREWLVAKRIEFEDRIAEAVEKMT